MASGNKENRLPLDAGDDGSLQETHGVDKQQRVCASGEVALPNVPSGGASVASTLHTEHCKKPVFRLPEENVLCKDYKIKMVLKWIFDRLAALVGLLLIWWLLVVIAILIKVKMPGGSAIFCQKRIGQGGKPFTMYKFRSMTVGHGGSSVSVAGESRITPLGAKLRRYKLDELPELWNVLIGDMSFVGPRPDVPGYADQLQGDDRRMLLLKPGITGPASLKYRNEEELLATVDNPQKYNDEVIYPDKVRINLYYLDHYSFVKDIELIIATVTGRKVVYGGEEI